MVKAPSPESPRDKVLNTQELRALWAAFEQHCGTIGWMFKLRLLTAQRGGEVATMRWEDLDLESGWWTIPAQFSKNKLSHRVPLSTPVLRMLQGLMDARDGKDGGWVFRGKRIGEHYKHIGQPTKVLRELSGVEFVPHDLRRAAASHMAGSGLNVPRLVISKILNHKEAGITHIYERHSYDDEKRDALERWARRLEEIVGNGQPDRPAPLAPARPVARRAPSTRRTQRVR
jgi:integrase